ncbi:MAG TPA: polysaccharide biosynthesis C-terminal domain-containing protein, partial [Candidatus Sulfotelmatobacter sp.]
PVYCAVMAIMAREALSEMKAKFSELWSALWPIMAATALMAAIVLLLREFVLAGRSDPPIIRLLFLSASGAIVYGATLFAMGGPVISEGAEVLGWILRRRRAEG